MRRTAPCGALNLPAGGINPLRLSSYPSHIFPTGAAGFPQTGNEELASSVNTDAQQRIIPWSPAGEPPVAFHSFRRWDNALPQVIGPLQPEIQEMISVENGGVQDCPTLVVVVLFTPRTGMVLKSTDFNTKISTKHCHPVTVVLERRDHCKAKF